nr:hypothetical protein [Gloeobacter morelensis]
MSEWDKPVPGGLGHACLHPPVHQQQRATAMDTVESKAGRDAAQIKRRVEELSARLGKTQDYL